MTTLGFPHKHYTVIKQVISKLTRECLIRYRNAELYATRTNAYLGKVGQGSMETKNKFISNIYLNLSICFGEVYDTSMPFLFFLLAFLYTFRFRQLRGTQKPCHRLQFSSLSWQPLPVPSWSLTCLLPATGCQETSTSGWSCLCTSTASMISATRESATLVCYSVLKLWPLPSGRSTSARTSCRATPWDSSCMTTATKTSQLWARLCTSSNTIATHVCGRG